MWLQRLYQCTTVHQLVTYSLAFFIAAFLKRIFFRSGKKSFIRKNNKVIYARTETDWVHHTICKALSSPDTINKKNVNNKLMTIISINNNHIDRANVYEIECFVYSLFSIVASGFVCLAIYFRWKWIQNKQKRN